MQREDEANFARVVQYYTDLSELGHAVERGTCVESVVITHSLTCDSQYSVVDRDGDYMW